MKSKFFLNGVILGLLAFFIVGCSSNEEAKTNNASVKGLKPLASIVKDEITNEEQVAFSEIDGELAVLHHSKEGVVFNKGNSSVVLEAGKEKTNKFWLEYDGKNIYAVWWRKYTGKKGKQLFVSVSKDKGSTFSSPKVISNDFGVLPTVSIASKPDGKVMIVYHDEREARRSKVYANYSDNAGDTWQKSDIRVDVDAKLPAASSADAEIITTSYIPYVFINRQLEAVVIWQQVDTLNGFKKLLVNSRKYKFDKAEWGEVSTVFSKDGESGVYYSCAEYGDNYLVMLALNGERLVSVLSTNGGSTWNALGANSNEPVSKDEKPVDFMVAAGTGDNFVVLTQRANLKEQTHIEKSIVSLKEKKWVGKPEALDKDKNHKFSRSSQPQIISLGDKGLFAAWNDYRHLNSTVYVSYSQDGQAWSSNSRFMSTPGKHYVKLLKLVPGKDSIWVLSKVLGSDGKKMLENIYFQKVKIENKLIALSEKIEDRQYLSKEKSKLRLEKRSKEFWKLRQEAKWESTWQYFDPLYRMKFGKNNWLRTQGKIRYGEFKLNEVEISDDDTLGLAKGELEVGINAMATPAGDLVEASPFKVQKLSGKWGWFYDDWYFMPNPFYLKIHDYSQ